MVSGSEFRAAERVAGLGRDGVSVRIERAAADPTRCPLAMTIIATRCRSGS